eukprot:3555553-Amphidinium_carterae.1
MHAQELLQKRSESETLRREVERLSAALQNANEEIADEKQARSNREQVLKSNCVQPNLRPIGSGTSVPI